MSFEIIDPSLWRDNLQPAMESLSLETRRESYLGVKAGKPSGDLSKDR